MIIVIIYFAQSNKTKNTRALRECRPRPRRIRSVSGWDWLSKFSRVFLDRRYVYDKIFVKICSVFREIRAKLWKNAISCSV